MIFYGYVFELGADVVLVLFRCLAGRHERQDVLPRRLSRVLLQLDSRDVVDVQLHLSRDNVSVVRKFSVRTQFSDRW